MSTKRQFLFLCFLGVLIVIFSCAEADNGHKQSPSPDSTLIDFSYIPTQKILSPFPIKLTARSGNFSGKINLYSRLGKIYPTHVYMRDGVWCGNVALYEPGKGNYLIARWSDNIPLNHDTNNSNNFDLLDENGELPKNALLEGKVSDYEGQGIAGASVQLYEEALDNDNGSLLATVITDDKGEYIINNIVPGNFRLHVQHKRYRDSILPVSLVATRTIHKNVQLTNLDSSNGAHIPVLLVPGIMGSSTSEYSLLHPYPRLPRVSPAWSDRVLELFDPGSGIGIGDYVGWRTLKTALTTLGYKEGVDMFVVPYDWSLSIPKIRDQYLKPWIEEAKRVSGKSQVDIIAHSMGGLVARSYIQSSNYANDVRKFAMVGTPNQGATVPYFLWEGGDPITADIVADSIKYELGTWYLYSNTLYYLYNTRHAGFICQYDVWTDIYKPISCDNNVIYNFLHNECLSIGQLASTLDNALLLKNESSTPLKLEENSLVKALNDIPCLNPRGCVNPDGGVYSFNSPSILAGNGSSSGIQSRLFIGGYRDSTPSSLYVTPQPLNYTGKFYKDGIPSSYVQAGGDTTVLTLSADINHIMPPEAPYIQDENLYSPPSSKNKHAYLIGGFTPLLAQFITGTLPIAQAVAATKTPSRLVVTIDGRVQPSLATVSGEIVNPSTKTFMADDTILSFENPPDGKYTLILQSPYNEDYLLEIFYTDSHGKSFVGKRAIGFYDKQLPLSIELKKHNLSHELIFDRRFDTPIALKMGNVENRVELRWEDPIGNKNDDVAYYEIYTRSTDEPYFRFLAKAIAKQYLTNTNWQNAKTKIYVVRAILKNGQTTLFSGPAFHMEST